MDVMVYVVAYFFSIIALMASQHWAMLVLMLVWVVAYIALISHFLPRLKRIAEEQADARSTMTGRVTDAYTNIATVKLFAHTRREADYARGAMREFLGTVYRQFRMVSTLDICLFTLNYSLFFLIGAVGITLWMHGALSVGSIAVAGITKIGRASCRERV